MKRAGAALGAALLAGCQTPGPPSPTTIVASDQGVLVPAVRIAAESLRDGARQPSDPGAGGAFEFNYFRGRGSDTQRVSSSDQPIKLGGTNFNGPQEVQHDFTLDWYEINARGRAFSSSPDRVFGMEFLLGAAVPRLAFRVSTPSAAASETFGGYGVQTGVGLILRMRPGTSAQGRITYYRGLGGNDDLANASRGEVYLVQALSSNIVVRAGYADWSIHVGRGSANASDLNVKMRGPSLGLEVVF